MSKKMEKRIAEFNETATKELPALTYQLRNVKNPEKALKRYFREGRSPLNIQLIGLLIGATIKPPKKDGKEYKIVFDLPLPTKKEMSKIIASLNVFIDMTEIPFLRKIGVIDGEYEYDEDDEEEDTEDSDDDMSIPKSDDEDTGEDYEEEVALTNCTYNVKYINKITRKEMKSAIFGSAAEEGMSTMYLNSMDAIQIASMGEELRKRINMERALVIGGITLVLGAAAATTAVVIHNKKKKKEEEEMIEENVIDPIPVDDDILDPEPIVDLDPEPLD